MNFREEMFEVVQPYIFIKDNILGHVYDFKACQILEDYLAKVCRKNDIMCNTSYLDYGVGPKHIRGVMTITLVEHYDVPEVFTIIYTRRNDINE